MHGPDSLSICDGPIVPAFHLPDADWATFNAMPARVKKQVSILLPWMQAIVGKSATAREAAKACGVNLKKLRRLLTAFKRSGWRGLVDMRALGRATQKVRPEFLPLWHGYVLANQRNTAKAHARMCRDAAAGKAIAGYESWTSWPKPPPGLSEDNLKRSRYMPAKADQLLARRGIAAARSALPCVWQDVSEVRPLEYVLFDDVELDFLVLLPGSFTPVKLRMIVAFDLCSRRVLGYGIRPGVTRADGTEDSLKLRDMKAVVVRLLRSFGIPSAWPMHFICERGTAAIKDQFAAALEEISVGNIVVHDTSMIAGRVLGFPDGAVGNSWGKAWLESHFNPMHGELAHLGGQKGRRYDLAPRELEGRKKECVKLWKAGQHLEIEERGAFRLPFMGLDEAVAEFDAALRNLDERTAHALQGFEQVQLWRTGEGDAWKSFRDLPEYLADKIEHLQWSTRLECPRERWERLIVDAPRTMPHESALYALLADQALVRFDAFHFHFQHERAEYRYVPGAELLPHLVDGEQYLLWFHGQDMGTVYLSRKAPHLGYIGKLTQFKRVRKGDLEAAQEAIALKTRAMNGAIERVRNVQLPTLQRRGMDLAENVDELTDIAHRAEAERTIIDIDGAPATGAASEIGSVVQAAGLSLAEQKARAKSEESSRRKAAKIGAVMARPSTEQPAAAVVEDWTAPEEISEPKNPNPTQPKDIEIW